MLSLIVHHNIHLNKEQRYALNDGTQIKTVGISVPVWVTETYTSEPAKEIFCIYQLDNPKTDIPIQIREDGYNIFLPFRKGIPLSITDDEWRKLNIENHYKLDALYHNCVEEVSSKKLLDIKDGGCGSMFYREHNKIKKENKIISVMHYVSISSMEDLINNLEAAY